jgi:hypothetical protein
MTVTFLALAGFVHVPLDVNIWMSVVSVSMAFQLSVIAEYQFVSPAAGLFIVTM